MDIIIRLENEADYKEVENLTREAFWNVYMPGCDEHYIVHKLRKVPAFVKELSFVACKDGKIIGNIMYSLAKVVDDQNKEEKILCMGPVAVLPEYQGKGIGARLIEYSSQEARKLGLKGVCIYGNPKYYNRFGYRNAQQYSISTPSGENFDEFMALELSEDSLKDITGRFYEDEVFHVDSEEVEEFDKQFPKKIKEVRDTHL